jgi:hypothetical protein
MLRVASTAPAPPRRIKSCRKGELPRAGFAFAFDLDEDAGTVAVSGKRSKLKELDVRLLNAIPKPLNVENMSITLFREAVGFLKSY